MAGERDRGKRFPIGVLVLVLSACGVAHKAALPPPPARPAEHVVRPGETLYKIGKIYGVPYAAIARANGLRDPSRIEVGQRLVIPFAGVSQPVKAELRLEPGRRELAPEAPDPHAPRFRWPVPTGMVTSGFGPRGSGFHDGIDIAAPVGAPVRAAADGSVAYSASLPGYGNMVILAHRGNYVTVYAHNEQNHVRDGQKVKQGDLIATVGQSGRATAPNLHFEVRKNNIARNPIYFLPPTMNAQGSPSAAPDVAAAGEQ